MKKFLTLILAVCAVSLVSCNKDNKDTVAQPKKFAKLVKTIKNSDVTETFTYDDNQRLIRRGTTPTDYVTFEYIGNIIRATSFWGKDAKYVSEIELENGVMTKGFTIKGEKRKPMETYKYNEQGYLVSMEFEGTHTYTWTNGNMTKDAYGSTTYEFTYGSAPSTVNYNFAEESIVTGFEGKTNANFAESSIRFTGSELKTNYAYEFDADGCPIKFTTSHNGRIESTYEITYY